MNSVVLIICIFAKSKLRKEDEGSSCWFNVPSQSISVFYSFKQLIYYSAMATGRLSVNTNLVEGLQLHSANAKLVGYCTRSEDELLDSSTAYYTRVFTLDTGVKCSLQQRTMGRVSEERALAEGAIVHIFASPSVCQYNSDTYTNLGYPIASRTVKSLNFSSTEDFMKLFENAFDPLLYNGLRIIAQTYMSIKQDSSPKSILSCHDCDAKVVNYYKWNNKDSNEVSSGTSKNCDQPDNIVNVQPNVGAGNWLGAELHFGLRDIAQKPTFSFNFENDGRVERDIYHPPTGLIEYELNNMIFITGVPIKPLKISYIYYKADQHPFFTLLPNLPLGLTFDCLTGTISGTPIAADEFKSYRIASAQPNLRLLDDQQVTNIGIRVIDGPYSVVNNLPTQFSLPSKWDKYYGLKYSIVSGSISGVQINENTGEISGNLASGSRVQLTVKVSRTIDFSIQISLLIN